MTLRYRLWRQVVFVSDSVFPGFGRVYRWIRDQRHYAKQRLNPTPFGFSLAGEYNREEMISGQGEVGVFERYANQADIVVDIGAHVGLYTHIACGLGRPVIAAEPNPDNVKLLLMNLRANGYDAQTEVLPVAVSNALGIMPLYGGQQGGTLLKEWGGQRGYNGLGANYSRLVPLTTLDRITASVRGINKRLLIKIDVEGNELGVLDGGKETLAMTPSPFWILEHGLREGFGPDGMNANFRPVFERFWSHGYEAYTVDDSQRPVSVADVDRWMRNGERDFGTINFLFVKDA